MESKRTYKVRITLPDGRSDVEGVSAHSWWEAENYFHGKYFEMQPNRKGYVALGKGVRKRKLIIK